MTIERELAFAPKTKALAQKIAALREPCVGCKHCTGLCEALIEALTLPEVLLGRGGR